MAKLRSATLVALALLGCLFGTEAQDPSSSVPEPRMGGISSSHPQGHATNPQNPSYNRPTQGHGQNPAQGGTTGGYYPGPQHPSQGGTTGGHYPGPQHPSQGGTTGGNYPGPQHPSQGGTTGGNYPGPQHPSQGGTTGGNYPGPQHPSQGGTTAGQYPGQVTPSQGGTTAGQYPGQVTPSQGGSTAGHYPGPGAPSQGGTTASRYPGPGAPSHGGTTASRYPGPGAPSHGGTTASRYPGPGAPSHGGTTASRYPGPGAPSQGGATPSRYPGPQKPAYPGKPQIPSQNPQNPVFPVKPQIPSQNPQNPVFPVKPQVPSQNPQNPVFPVKPQIPSQNPQAPSHTGYPSGSHSGSYNPSATGGHASGYPSNPSVGSHTSRYPSNPAVGSHTSRYPSNPVVGSHTSRYPSNPSGGSNTSPIAPYPGGKPQVVKPQQQTGSYPTKNPKRPIPPPQTPKLPPKGPVLPPPKNTPQVKYSPRGYGQSQQDQQVPKPQQLSEQYRPQQAASSQGSSIYQGNMQKQPAFHTCEVEPSQRVPCGSFDISAAACQAISCCHDGHSCYFAKAVTVQCTKDAYFIVIVARDSTIPSIDLESVLLMGSGPGCTHVDSNSDFAIYFFPVTDCGTIVLEEPGVIIYENRMSSSFEIGAGPFGMTTRDSTYDLLFQCRYTGTSVEALVIDLVLQDPPLPVAAFGPLRVQMKLGKGYCSVKGCDEVEAAYTAFYTDAEFPVPKVLRDPVFVEVELLERTDPYLVLTLGRCWTTATPNPHSLPQWDLLIDGCPYTHDNYMTSLVDVQYSPDLEFPGHHRRFFFKMFSFVDTSVMEPTRQQVYIHCSTSLCQAMPGSNCDPHCFRKMRKRDAEAPDNTYKTVATTGPVVYTAA